MSGVRIWSRTYAILYSSTSEGVEQSGFQSSVSRHGVELLENLVRAPSLASKFHLHNDAENRKFACFG